MCRWSDWLAVVKIVSGSKVWRRSYEWLRRSPYSFMMNVNVCRASAADTKKSWMHCEQTNG